MVGRLCFSVEFQHVYLFEAHLENIKFEFEGKHEEKYYFSLQAQTPEGTIEGVSKCSCAEPIYESQLNSTSIEYPNPQTSTADMPYLQFQTACALLSSSCIRITLWISPDNKTAELLKLEGSFMTEPNEEQKEKDDCCADPNGKKMEIDCGNQIKAIRKNTILERIETDPLFGVCHISFPKLLGDEMTVFDKIDAALIHKEIVP